MSAKDVFTLFTKESPLYERLAAKMKKIAEGAYGDAGIHCRVLGRAKDVDSLVKKCITKKKKYEDVGDKAGLRVLPTYPDERGRAIDVLKGIFDVTELDEKVDGLEPDQFGYRGFHASATLKPSDALGDDSDLSSLICEVQVHSPGESLWATINHDLSYKSATDLPRDVKRSLHRISAVLELVDDEMSKAREKLLHGPDAAVAKTLASCEKHFWRFVPKQYNKDLAVQIIGALQPIATLTEFESGIDAFVSAHKRELTNIFRNRARAFDYTLLSQPESLLVFYLLEKQAEPECERVWPVDSLLWEGLKTAWSGVAQI